MHTIEIIGKSTVLEFPETAHEFNREQVLSFAFLTSLYQSNKITYTQYKTRLVYSFLNLKRTADFSKEENEPIAENIQQIGVLVDDYFNIKIENGKEIKLIKNDFLLQKLNTVTANGHTFHGPKDALLNTVYGEYLQLISALNDFSRTGEEQFLDKIVATIYRPKKENYERIFNHPSFDGDIREKFNPNLTNHYTATLATLPHHVKFAIYLYVASSQYFIANNTALDIGGGNTIDLTMLFETSTVSQPNSLGMVGTLYSLAETKVFGAAKDVAEQNTYDILAFLVRQKQEIENLKQPTNVTTA